LFSGATFWQTVLTSAKFWHGGPLSSLITAVGDLVEITEGTSKEAGLIRG